jgi:hypothetical protein
MEDIGNHIAAGNELTPEVYREIQAPGGSLPLHPGTLPNGQVGGAHGDEGINPNVPRTPGGYLPGGVTAHWAPQYGNPPGYGNPPTPSGPYQGPQTPAPTTHRMTPEQLDNFNQVADQEMAQGHGHTTNKPDRFSSLLDGSDRRWVILEGAKFVAANTDTLDDSHELAVRAYDYAALKTSTFTPRRSALVCRAFVAKVIDLGKQAYRPPVVRRTAAAFVDFDDSAMYLC